MKQTKYSVIVVGSGIAGLYAAIKLKKEADLPDGILIITKSKLSESNSKYAQGGMVCVLPENKLDSCTLHIEDTVKAGAGLTDAQTARFISENSAKVVRELQNLGVDFDKDEDNQLKFTKEAAHSVNRILHAGGDATGFCIENALVKYLSKQKDITIYEDTLAVEIVTDKNNEAKGVITYNYERDEYEYAATSALILATGGTGQLYAYTTNPDITTGDGTALAYKAGATVKDMEFVQFHPTAFALGDNGTMFLISEAVRGEGAKLVDKDGNTFMEEYDERLELAPRDIVTRAIYSEMNKKSLANVYLDATHISEENFGKRFPTIYATCVRYGINPSKTYIPVSPSAHYFMGGIKTDIKGRTSVKGLYATGETACTGLHGANRLASNSILECAVTSYELVNYLKTLNLSADNTEDEKIAETIKLYEQAAVTTKCSDPNAIKKEIKKLMWQNVGIVRTGEKLEAAKTKLKEISKEFGDASKCRSREEYEIRNMLTVAKLITDFAIERKESRGAHFRADYPQTDKKAISKELSITQAKYEN